MFEGSPSYPVAGAARDPGGAGRGLALPYLGDLLFDGDDDGGPDGPGRARSALPTVVYVPFPAVSAAPHTPVDVDDHEGVGGARGRDVHGGPGEPGDLTLLDEMGHQGSGPIDLRGPGGPGPPDGTVVDRGPAAPTSAGTDVPYPAAPHDDGGAVAGPTGVAAPAPLEASRSMLQELSQPLVLAVVSPVLGAVLGITFMLADSALGLLGVAATLAGVAIGGVGAFGVVRRVRRDIDEPVTALRGTLARLVGGDVRARVDASGDTPLRPLLDEFDAAVDLVGRRMDRLRRKAEWGDQSRMIFEALELAEDEPEAYGVMNDALALMDPARSVELLMAPRGAQRLRVMANNPAAEPPGCMVDSLDGCVAVRRGQVIVAESSESINACPRLRGRAIGPCSAACVPVTVSGHPIGVLHAVGPDRDPPDAELIDRLSSVAAQVGTRVGALRMLESSREEAATDGLTGLPNRRVLESQLAQLLEAEVAFVMVLADLDKFKVLNDTYGHEAGDRALQLFARVLQDNIRGHDLVARVGGEEFVVVYPDMSVLRSIEAIERIRQALGAAIAVSSVQPFTCSFGVTHSTVGASALEILRVADAGLLRAKDIGGDQVVYSDEGLAAEVFGANNRRGRLDVRID